MTTLISKVRTTALLCGIILCFSRRSPARRKTLTALAPAQTKSKSKTSPSILRPSREVGEKVTWINRDEEPHTIVSVEKQFKKSSALDTDQEITITAGAPGTYTYFCSVHPKMTGTIVVEK